MGVDGDLKRREIAIDAAIFELLCFIFAPTALTRNAETRVIHDNDKIATFFEAFGSILY